MKKLIVALLALGISSAFAAEIQVMDVALTHVSSRDTSVEARFQMNKTTGEGSVVVTVTEMRWTTEGWCPNSESCIPTQVSRPYTILRDSVKVEGLALHGDQMIYAGRDGDVNCGRLGESSVFHRPTLFLNGNCKLSGKVTGNLNSARVNVIMKTK